MSEFLVTATSEIGAAPAEVYAALADYRVAHPAILPKVFTRLTVLEGGQGAGTVVQVEMQTMGRRTTLNLTVSEPEPGRVLAEADDAAGVRTTFTVDPLDGGARSQVTIASVFAEPGGLLGPLQVAMMRAYTRKLYRKELANLDAWMRRPPEGQKEG
jgi:hypothetical protein